MFGSMLAQSAGHLVVAGVVAGIVVVVVATTAVRAISGASVPPLLSMDSDLEAVSRHPTDGGFGALPVQATP